MKAIPVGRWRVGNAYVEISNYWWVSSTNRICRPIRISPPCTNGGGGELANTQAKETFHSGMAVVVAVVVMVGGGPRTWGRRDTGTRAIGSACRNCCRCDAMQVGYATSSTRVDLKGNSIEWNADERAAVLNSAVMEIICANSCRVSRAIRAVLRQRNTAKNLLHQAGEIEGKKSPKRT